MTGYWGTLLVVLVSYGAGVAMTLALVWLSLRNRP
jgi:hypothetical protein